MPREEVIRKGRLDAVNRNVVVATHAIQLDIVGIARYTRGSTALSPLVWRSDYAEEPLCSRR
jgi:hypothetical protein